MESEFNKALEENAEWKKKYGDILPRFNNAYDEMAPYAKSREFVNEIFYRNVEVFGMISRLKRIVKTYEDEGYNAIEDRVSGVKNYLGGFYKNYDAVIDQQIAENLLSVYYQEVEDGHQAPYAKDQLEFAGDNVKIMTATLFEKSFLSKGDLVMKILTDNPEGFFKQLSGDFIFQFVKETLAYNETTVLKSYNSYNKEIQISQRVYMAALMEVFSDRRFFPDANGTMRVSYGKVEGYSVGDSLTYDFSTYLDGLVAKYIPGDYEFDVPAKLLELHAEKDYGQYAAKNGKVPVCFLGSNHTTGGNSGSPVIDAHGNFVGINFDRTWHGTMSDINYDKEICRNIMVDAR